MDWDKIRIFHTVADAGSFTKAGEAMNLSQSAVSRQISALEDDLGTTLFHRHARGLLLTEQGETLYRTAHEVVSKLALTEARLKDSKESPKGDLVITSTVGFGSIWLAPRLAEFVELYPQINVSLITEDRELDLGMREADCAIRLRPPVQGDLIQRKLLTIHHHIYASHEYLGAHGAPQTPTDLTDHKIVIYGERSELLNKAPLNWLEVIGMPDGDHRKPVASINNINGVMRAIEAGMGLGVLPDYLAEGNPRLVRVLPDEEGPTYELYFVYPEELRNSKRIGVFRDFLIRKIDVARF